MTLSARDAVAADPASAPRSPETPVTSRPRRRRTPLQRRARIGQLFAAPGALALLFVSIVPLLVAIGLSLFRYDLLTRPVFVGLKNYTDALGDRDFWAAVGHTLEFAFEQVPIGTVTALAVAVLLNQRLPGRSLYRTIVYLPQAASYVVVALVWSFLYEPTLGLINQAIHVLGGPTVYWLTDTSTVMPALVIMSIWRNLGYYMVIFLAALQSIPGDLKEAAAVDGANTWRVFWHITLPLLSNVTGFVVITWFLGALQMFTQAYVMTGGGPVDATTTIVYRIYQDAFLFLRVGRACAVAVMMFAVVAVITVLTRSFARHTRKAAA